jgi:hypothetical protein
MMSTMALRARTVLFSNLRDFYSLRKPLLKSD